VEQTFYPAWQRYQTALKQRNNAIRQHSSRDLIQIWDKELIEAGEVLHRSRQLYTKELQQLLNQYIHPVLGEFDFSLQYQPGWGKQDSLKQALEQSLTSDLERGFTTVGPQRADISIKLDGRLASDRISRGQQKILVTCLLLAQAGLYNIKTDRECILLIDDVAAELDTDNRAKLLSVLQDMKVQMFLTAIGDQTLKPMMENSSTSKMFHVEQGHLTEVV
jgi:DNA replication and repair protein RecF